MSDIPEPPYKLNEKQTRRRKKDTHPVSSQFDRWMYDQVFSHILTAIAFLPIFPAHQVFQIHIMIKPASIPKTFEAAVSELETIVRQMETGSLPLEQALEQYQRGVILLRHCQDRLNAAEQQVRILEGNTSIPFRPDDSGMNDSAHQDDSIRD